MPEVKIADLSAQISAVLRPLGITRSSKSCRMVCECIERICEQEDRLEAVQKEIYMPVAEMHHCQWSAVQSAVRRAAKIAWETDPQQVQALAGYPLDGMPSAVQFLEMIYNSLVRE